MCVFILQEDKIPDLLRNQSDVTHDANKYKEKGYFFFFTFLSFAKHTNKVDNKKNQEFLNYNLANDLSEMKYNLWKSFSSLISFNN